MKLDCAVSYLRALLEPGPLPSTAALTQCRAAGFSQATVRRAKCKLGVVSRRQHNESLSPNGISSQPWEWSLRNEQLTVKQILYGNTLIGKFIADCLVIDPTKTISAGDLRDLFRGWRETQGLTEADLPWSTVTRILGEIGVECCMLMWRGSGSRKDGTYKPVPEKSQEPGVSSSHAGEWAYKKPSSRNGGGF